MLVHPISVQGAWSHGILAGGHAADGAPGPPWEIQGSDSTAPPSPKNNPQLPASKTVLS